MPERSLPCGDRASLLLPEMDLLFFRVVGVGLPVWDSSLVAITFKDWLISYRFIGVTDAFLSTYFSSLIIFLAFFSSFSSISTCISRNTIFSSFNFDSYMSRATCALSSEKCYYPII